MNEYINAYLIFLRDKKKSSDNTVEAYVRDLTSFENYLDKRGLNDITSVKQEDIIGFLMDMKKENLSTATITRRLASTRSFYKFMLDENHVIVNPAKDIKAPKVVRGEIEYLTIDEIEKLLSLPDESPKGIRDKAIFEVLYGTGIMVSELVELRLKDLNLRMGFITCNGNHGKARIVPLGDYAKYAMKRYLSESRPTFIKSDDGNDEEAALFVNFMGNAFTRQGLWKILNSYGEKADISKKLTLQIIRHSFAVHMIENGADLKTLQELLGHEDISATQVYLQFRKNKIKEVYDRTHPRAIAKK
ncbi:MAG: tyrosine recombinase [Clostridiales bacterium]|nr:tyrosine recombinase [Clostridiales bacterium]MDD7347701.1 tyrosine recombinase [Clostridiales bacterium]